MLRNTVLLTHIFLETTSGLLTRRAPVSFINIRTFQSKERVCIYEAMQQRRVQSKLLREPFGKLSGESRLSYNRNQNIQMAEAFKSFE